MLLHLFLSNLVLGVFLGAILAITRRIDAMRKTEPCRTCNGRGQSLDYLQAPCEACSGSGVLQRTTGRQQYAGWVRLYAENGRRWECVCGPTSRNRVERELALLVIANEDGGRVVLPRGVEPVVPPES